MPELLVTVDEGDVELFETTAATARDLERSGAKRIGRPARGTSPRRGQRLSLADTATTEQRIELVLDSNPHLAALCASDARPGESKPGQPDDAINRLVDQLSERVAERLGRTKHEPPDSKVDELLPADCPDWFRSMFVAA
jgi:hypothetical protein